MQATQPATQQAASTSVRTFLESYPPDIAVDIEDVATTDRQGIFVFNCPPIALYCESSSCEGIRFFDKYSGDIYLGGQGWHFGDVHYRCRHCETKTKAFAIAAIKTSGAAGKAQKLGELPPFGPHTPARLIKMIGPDRELFLQGRRAEIRGLGIGAFAYYRRVVEHQKARIINEIGRVATTLGADKETQALFAKAASETQFSTAIGIVKDGIPKSLLIQGHNPLILLHDALSEGLHAENDSRCLELAQSIRVVLGELAERMATALSENTELAEAVSILLNRKVSNTPKPPK